LGEAEHWQFLRVLGRKLRSELSNQNGDTRTVLIKREFQFSKVSKQNRGTGMYVREVDFREQS